MNKETIERWTKGLWSGAAVTWVVVLVFLLTVAATQTGCSTAKAFGRMISAVGEDFEGAAQGIENNIADKN